MNMKKLATLLSPMTKDGSLDEDKGIRDKGVGFAHYASPKKRRGGETDGSADDIHDDCKKKKANRSANIGKKDGLAHNSQVSKMTTMKAGYSDHEIFLKLCELYENAGEPIDKNAIFLEAVGGVDKRKRVYGVGSSQTLFYKPETIPSSSSPDAENQKLQEELKIMKDKMKVMEDKIAKILEVTSAQVTQTPATDLDSENDVRMKRE
ncbi:uncharacterized protein LOC141672327 isoform X3 [Apium graveolens]|uniref:uncharacterized protein LOC141672327 isoform X3 n=1 Tax=Apium graveolens TaxID=4045 RepID=UPI003D798D16